MSPDEFSAAFKGSPMERATLRGLKRNAAVALGKVRSRDDIDVLTRAHVDEAPLVREHAAWARARIAARADAEPDAPASGTSTVRRAAASA